MCYNLKNETIRNHICFIFRKIKKQILALGLYFLTKIQFMAHAELFCL